MTISQFLISNLTIMLMMIISLLTLNNIIININSAELTHEILVVKASAATPA